MNHGRAKGEQPASIIKNYVVIVAVVVVVLAGLRFVAPFGILWAQELRSRFRYAGVNQQTFETVIRPAAQWVREFRKHEGRFPNEDELNAHAKTLSKTARWIGIYDSVDSAPTAINDHWQSGIDFVLIANTGEWNLYYHSWNDEERMYWTD